ncbi:restriction endonuclease subunit S [Flagellimonas oceanensis]|uniref:restriction endonuclease subunit S n=1 Tax=Flagellimonas oceanensis TaxID=2499163 RepID=UPI000F8C599B|nr:restriction endonuclease subunit S [Allomuricauda oceanensis]
MTKEHKIGDIVTLSQGQVINSKTSHLVTAKGLPLLRIGDMINNRQEIYIDKEKVPKKNIAHKKDIIFSRTGQVGLVFRNQNGVVHNNCFKVKPDEDVLNPDYLFWFLKSPKTYKWVQQLAAGAAQPDLPHGAFNSIKINVPNLQTQKKIASILSAFDDLIENNNQRISLSEEMAEEIYKEWFVRFRFPGYQNTKFFDEKGNEVPHGTKGAIPEGWKEGKIQDLVELKKGKIITKSTVTEGNIPVVAGGLNPAYYHNRANTCSPTITISSSGANAGFVNLYFEDIWVSDCSYLDSKMSKWFYFFYCTFKTRQAEVFHLQRGAAQPHVYSKDIHKLKLIYPSEKLLKYFEGLIIPFFEEIKLLKNKNQALKETRDLLLPRLISGKLSVEHLKLKEVELAKVAELK